MSNNPIEAISLDAIEKAISITEQYIEAIYEATSSDKKPHLKQDGLSYCSLALKLLPPENDFIDMYRGLQRILNLPYHESELYSVNVYINEDGLFEKIETIENELIKRQTEIRWLRGEKGEQVAETEKEGIVDKTVNIRDISGSPTIVIQQTGKEANQEVTIDKGQDEKVGKDAGRVQEGIVEKIKSYLSFMSPIIEFFKLIFSFFKSGG